MPGLVGAVARGGRPIWSDGVGWADLAVDEPPDADTQFLIASISKTFTAVMVMALRDEGRLSLDDGIDEHIPESKHGAVTIRQMLSHTTGMQREPVGDVWDTLEFPDRSELVSGWNEAERVLRPHYKWHYSNLAYSMLGELVARLDGREWVESLQARILDPLQLRRTTLGLVSPPVATGYYVPPWTDVPVHEPLLDSLAMSAAGGLASTANDLATWASFLADPDEGVLKRATLDEMCQPQIIADLDRWQTGHSLGFQLIRSDDRVYVGHTGGMPGHITGMFVERSTSTAGIVLMNSSASPDPGALSVGLAAYVIDNDPAEPELWRPGTEVPDEFAGVIGKWYSEGQPFTFSVRQGRLEARHDALPPHRPSSVFAKIDDDLYRTESGREAGELLRITRDGSGTVTQLHWATYLVTREPQEFRKQ